MNLTLARKIDVSRLAIPLIWLFQLSGVIGISLGYESWFLNKTPVNLTLIFILFLLNFPVDSPKKFAAAGFLFLMGLCVEWIGVHYDFLFGSYHYGQNLGFKVGEVPILIGINWMLLTFVSACIVTNYINNKWLRILAGGALMLVLDFFMEMSAAEFGFWFWEEDTAPLRNYVAWFGVAMVLHFIYQKTKIFGNVLFCAHVYISQLVFFIYFYVYHQI